MKLIRLIAVLLLILPLSCGKKDRGEITIKWWQFWTSPEVKPTVEKLIQDFEQSNSGWTVELGDLTWSDGHEKIVISLAAGKGPDLIELGSDWVCEFASTGKLYDLTDDLGDLLTELSLWEPVIYKDKYYGVPWLLGTRVLFCNRTLLNQAGYPPDWLPRDWAALMQASYRINTLGDDTYGFGSNSAERHRLYKKYLPFFWSAGGTIFDEYKTEIRFACDAGERSLEYYVKLSETGIIETQSRLDDYFAQGQIGFLISGDWLIQKLVEQDNDFEFFVSNLPGLSHDQMGISFAGGEYLVINAASENKEAALELIRHLVSKENNQLFCDAVGSFTPANIHATSVSDSTLAGVATVFRYQLQNSRSTPVHPAWVYIEEALERGIESAIYHKSTSQEALRKIDLECAEILEYHGYK